MNILYVYSDEKVEWNCSNWRCAMPARAINKTKKHRARLLFIREWEKARSKRVIELTAWADIIVLQRRIVVRTMELIVYAQSEGKKVVVDLDDSYHKIDRYNGVSYNFWQNNVAVTEDGRKIRYTIPVLQQLEMGVKLADALTSPSQVILDDWEMFTNNRYLMPNYIPSRMYDVRPYDNHKNRDHFIIGWGGSSSHLGSFLNSGVIRALNTVLDRRPVVLVLIGNDKRIPVRLRNSPNIKTVLWMPYNIWTKSIKKFDIGIAPLNKTYDKRRSPIKLFEYLVTGVPWVATKGSAYPDPFGEIGSFVQNTTSGWRRGLLNVIDNYAEFQEIARYARETFTKDIDLYENTHHIIETYEDILNA